MQQEDIFPQNRVFYSCIQDQHQEKPIIGFCLSKECKYAPEFCFLCITNEEFHKDHLSHCKDFQQIQTILDRHKTDYKKTALEGFIKINHSFNDIIIEIQKNLKYKQQDILRKLNQCQIKIKTLNKDVLDIIQFLDESFQQLQKQDYSIAFKIKKIKQIIAKQSKNDMYTPLINKIFDKQNSFRKKISIYELILKSSLIYLKKAIQLKEQYKWKEAISFLDNAISRHPELIHAYTQKGEILNEMQKFEDSMKHFHKAISFNSINTYKECIKIAMYLEKSVNYMNCFQFYDMAMKIEPSNLNTYMHKASALVKFSDYINAILCYRNANQINSKNFTIGIKLVALGEELTKSKNYSVAINCYDEIIRTYPWLSEIHMAKAKLLQQLGNEKEAIIWKQVADKCKSSEKNFYYSKAAQLEGEDNFNETLKCFIQARNLNPMDQIPIYKICQFAKRLEKQKKFDEALKCFDEIIQLDSDYLEVQYKKGQLLQKLKKFAESFLVYIYVNKKDQGRYKSELSLTPLAHTLNEKLNSQKLIQCYDDAIKINPQKNQLYELKAEQLEKQGKLQEAVSCFYELSKFNKNDLHGLKMIKLAEQLKQQDRYEEVLLQCDQVIQFYPYLIKSYLIKASILIQEDDYKNALRNLDEAIKFKPKKCKIYYIKAEILQKSGGKMVETIKCLNQVVALKPDHDKMKSIIKTKGQMLTQLKNFKEALLCLRLDQIEELHKKRLIQLI